MHPQQIEEYLRREITVRLNTFFRNAVEIQDVYNKLKHQTDLDERQGSPISKERKRLLRFCEFLFQGEP